jgi:hypothetical protein
MGALTTSVTDKLEPFRVAVTTALTLPVTVPLEARKLALV